MTKRKIIAACIATVALGVVWWICRGEEDPRELALGEWRESSGRLQVEVQPGEAAWRGMGRGKIRYEWVDTEHRPYRLRFTYRGADYEALLHFDGRNTAIFEPQVWHKLPPGMQEQLRDFNRQHGRPDTEFRFIFRRNKSPNR